MMMDFDTVNGMMGGFGSGAYLLMWLSYLLIIAFLVLGIIAFWKYINKK